MYGAALTKRNMMLGSDPSLSYVFSCLNERLIEKAKRLAKLFLEGNLVLFVGILVYCSTFINLFLFQIGAGCSKGTGLPTWGALLTQLANKAGLSAAELKHLGKYCYINIIKLAN